LLLEYAFFARKSFCEKLQNEDFDKDCRQGNEVLLYEALTDHILHRLRFPRFLQHIKECMSTDHELIIDGLLEHGRLGLEQLINTVRRKRTSRGGAEFENDIFNKAFWHLVKERLVIQVEVGFSETQSVSSNAAATGISKGIGELLLDWICVA